MAFEYFLYTTDFNNTLVDRSNTSFAPLPPNTGQIFIDFFIPTNQPLFYYRESGGTIVLNDDDTINDYLNATVPPTEEETIFTGYTANTLTQIQDRVRWLSDWTGGTYQRNDMVRDNGYTLIANKETSDRPAPYAIGDRFFVSGLDDEPSWDTNSEFENQVVVGQRYTASASTFIYTARFWIINDPNVTYEMWLVTEPFGNPDYRVLIPEFSPVEGQQDRWINIGVGSNLVSSGQTFDVVMVIRSSETPVTFTGEWDYKRKNGSPDSDDGEAWHQNNGRQIRFSEDDDSGSNRSADLDNINIGSNIVGGGINWDVIGASKSGGVYFFDVEPTTRASENKYNFEFTYFAKTSIDYDFITNYYSAVPQVSGIFSTTGYTGSGATTNQNAYGVDIEIQDAYISPDWDNVPANGLGNGSGNQEITFWGAIEGDIDNQDDLIQRLNGKADITGDTFTGDVTVNAEFFVSGVTSPILSATESGVTLNGDSGTGNGTINWNGEFLEFDSPSTTGNLQFGWIQGDTATPHTYGIRQTGLAGYFFLYPNAPTPQIVAGDDSFTSAFYIDGNGNKDIILNALDTGPGTPLDKKTVIGKGGLNILGISGGSVTFQVPTGVTSYSILLPQNDGEFGQKLTTDGNGVLSWESETITAITGIQIRRTTNFPLPATFGDITFDTVDFQNDSDILSADTINTDRIIVGQDGLYQLSYDGVGDDGAELRFIINDSTVVNGSTKNVFSTVTGIATIQTQKDISNEVLAELSQGDYITLQGQRSGADLLAGATVKVIKLDSTRGKRGEKGETGAGSTVFVENNGVNPSPTGGTYSVLNFGDGVTAIDAGDGQTVNISASTLPVVLNKLQLVDGVGGQATNNVTPAAITWNTQEIIDTNVYSHTTGTSIITVLKGGSYRFSYNLRTSSTDGTRGNQGATMRLNGGSFILPTTTASYKRNTSNNETSNSFSSYVFNLSASDTIELVGYRLGDAANLQTVAGESFINIEYLG